MIENNTPRSIESLLKERTYLKGELANLGRRSIGRNIGYSRGYGGGHNSKRASGMQARITEIEDQLDALGEPVPWYDRIEANHYR